MVLQVRVVHPLGEQVVDLPERPRDNPIVVGRADGVDLQIPAVGISRRHCALFLQDGQWVIHDTKSTAGTFVNGHRIDGPTAIASGDHITLGTDASPPTLTIDPYKLLAATAPSKFNTPLPTASGRPPIPRPTAPRAHVPPPTPSAPYPVPTATVEADALPDGASQDMAAVDWLTSASATAGRSRAVPYYIPKRTAWTGGTITALIIGSLVIVGGAAWYIAKHMPPPAAPVAVKPKPAPTVITPAPTTQKTAPLVLPKPAPNADDERDKRMAARQGDPAWAEIEDAHAGRLTPSEAVSKYLEYLHDNPKTPYAADVRRFIDEDLDRAWWNHITELLESRSRLAMRVSEKLAELATSQDPDFRERVTKEREELDEDIKKLDDQLKELNYQSKQPPQLADTEMMTALRAARDPALYEAWKKRAEDLIRATRGRSPLW